jgi:hypothetical protein
MGYVPQGVAWSYRVERVRGPGSGGHGGRLPRRLLGQEQALDGEKVLYRHGHARFTSMAIPLWPTPGMSLAMTLRHRWIVHAMQDVAPDRMQAQRQPAVAGA